MKNKKGISPLIATVLLIGVVIAIVASIMLWSRTIIKEEIEKRAPTAQGKLTCQTEVGIDVEDVCIDDRRIKVMLRNTKERVIPKVRGRVIGVGDETFVEDWAEKTITGFERKTIYFGYRSDIVPNYIEIIPVIFQEGDGGAVEVVCTDLMVRSTALKPCIE